MSTLLNLFERVPRSWIRAGEPAGLILHNAGLNGFSFVDVHHVALASSDTEAEFFASPESTWGRLSQARPAPQQNGVIRGPMRTLDSFASEHGLPPPQAAGGTVLE